MQMRQLGGSCDADKEYVSSDIRVMILTGCPDVPLSTARVMVFVVQVPTRHTTLGFGYTAWLGLVFLEVSRMF